MLAWKWSITGDIKHIWIDKNSLNLENQIQIHLLSHCIAQFIESDLDVNINVNQEKWHSSTKNNIDDISKPLLAWFLRESFFKLLNDKVTLINRITKTTGKSLTVKPTISICISKAWTSIGFEKMVLMVKMNHCYAEWSSPKLLIVMVLKWQKKKKKWKKVLQWKTNHLYKLRWTRSNSEKNNTDARRTSFGQSLKILPQITPLPINLPNYKRTGQGLHWNQSPKQSVNKQQFL